jgi:hypothetical protein
MLCDQVGLTIVSATLTCNAAALNFTTGLENCEDLKRIGSVGLRVKLKAKPAKNGAPKSHGEKHDS